MNFSQMDYVIFTGVLFVKETTGSGPRHNLFAWCQMIIFYWISICALALIHPV